MTGEQTTLTIIVVAIIASLTFGILGYQKIQVSKIKAETEQIRAKEGVKLKFGITKEK